jgi:hypothetical protein
MGGLTGKKQCLVHRCNQHRSVIGAGAQTKVRVRTTRPGIRGPARDPNVDRLHAGETTLGAYPDKEARATVRLVIGTSHDEHCIVATEPK